MSDLLMTEQVEKWRSEISAIRGKITDFRHEHPGWKERVEHVEGALTCCLVTLAYTKEEFMRFEIQSEDRERGPHKQFMSRGIGMDILPCCFVCGRTTRNPEANHYIHNISAFVKSKEEGEEIVQWFGTKTAVGQGIPEGSDPVQVARLDIRDWEPGYIQLKVGSCDEHLPNLRFLHGKSNRHGVIRQRDVEEAISHYSPLPLACPNDPS